MSTIHFILSAICMICKYDHRMVYYWFSDPQVPGLTPQTWRPESYKSYAYSTLLSFLFGALFTFFYIKIGVNYVLPGVVWSNIKLGLICFACFSLVSGINNAVYVNYDKKFVAGLLTASCLNYIAAAIIASFFYWR